MSRKSATVLRSDGPQEILESLWRDAAIWKSRLAGERMELLPEQASPDKESAADPS